MEEVNLKISIGQADSLLRLLTDEIPDIGFEAARTDLHEYRERLINYREDLRSIQHQLRDVCGLPPKEPEESQGRPTA